MEENEGEGETGGASRGTESVPAPPPELCDGQHRAGTGLRPPMNGGLRRFA